MSSDDLQWFRRKNAVLFRYEGQLYPVAVCMMARHAAFIAEAPALLRVIEEMAANGNTPETRQLCRFALDRVHEALKTPEESIQ